MSVAVQNLELETKAVNNEVEQYVGELRELRARELKLAHIVNACEELLDRGLERSNDINAGDVLRIETLKRLVRDPDVANWMDLLRAANKAPLKRLVETGRPSIDQGEF